MSQLPEWVEDNKFQIVMGLVGLVFLIIGGLQAVSKQMGEDSRIEILETSTEAIEQVTVVVDVSGAVENPGVYEFESGARANDVLMAAGGLSADADRGYVSRAMNLAEKIIDGSKIYIPYKDDPRNVVLGVESGNVGVSRGSDAISINTSSASELDSLWGVGSVRANQIIENRPYGSIEELKTKAGIPQNVLDTNKGKLSL